MADIGPFLQSVKLPVMPEVAQALIRTLNDPEADMTTVGRVISKDPALTATLLRMANSAIFGLSRSVQTLDSAINVVGMAQIRVRALSICMAQVFALPPAINRLEFWRNSMVCAGYAKWLAGHARIDEQQAWLTGMMVRLGELIIAQRQPGLIAQIEMLPRAPGERWTRERSLCGFDEGQITAEVARRWDFPDSVTQALNDCVQPMSAAQLSKSSMVTHLAALLADEAAPNADSLQSLPLEVIQALGLDLAELQATLPNAESFSDISMLQG